MGKGSGRCIEDINKIRNNWDGIFKKRDKKQITKVIIEFEMPGYPSIDEINLSLIHISEPTRPY